MTTYTPMSPEERSEVAALLHSANDEAYWYAKPLPDLLAAARCFALFGSDDNGLIVDPRTGYIHNPEY